jgi:hypothetical protein
MSYIAILHGDERLEHEPIVTTVLGGAWIDRDLGPQFTDPCPTCQRLTRSVYRTARYEIVERLDGPPGFQGILICKLLEVNERDW